MKGVPNQLRVIHFPQIPCKGFSVEVKDELEAYKIMQVLANQHLFLFEQKIIPDYANSISVQMWSNDIDGEGEQGWTDYWNEDEQMFWDDFEETYIHNPHPLQS